MLRLLHWARAWGKDGLVTVPEYYHNAVFYSTLFRFLSPERQGRFEALARDLGHLHVAAASSAVAEGRVFESGNMEPLEWEPAEMVAALGEPLKRYLASPEYDAAVRASRERVGFVVRGR